MNKLDFDKLICHVCNRPKDKGTHSFWGTDDRNQVVCFDCIDGRLEYPDKQDDFDPWRNQ